MSRLFRIFTLAALAMLVLALPSSSLARKSHHVKHKAAHKADRNRDGLPDRWEKANRLSLRVNQASRDQDKDGANNAAEFVAGTNPHDSDSDDDGMKDGAETVGTIASFDATSGTLVITTAGGPVSGKVTDRTEIKLVGGAPMAIAAHRGDGGDDEQGDEPAGPTGPIGSDHGDDDNENEGDDDGHDGCRPFPPSGATGATGASGATGATGPVGPADCGHHHGEGSGSKADLVPGAVVREAELKLTAGGPVWDELKIVSAAPAAAPAA